MMIVDTMTQLEVMGLIRKDCDTIITMIENKKPALRKICEKMLGVNKKKFVSIPVSPMKSDLGLTYQIDFIGNIERCEFRCTTKFFYRNHMNYADLTQDAISVFASHSLDRYAERVLEDESVGNKEVFDKYLHKGINNSFHIVLPSPTHEHTVYYVRTDGLFLGDMQSVDLCFNWYNTCLSINELFESEYRIYNTFGSMTQFINKLKFDPIRRSLDRPSNSGKMKKYLAANSGMRPAYLKYLEQNYMLFLVLKDYGYDKMSKEGEFDQIFNDLTSLLIENNIKPEKLDPYDEECGIIIKGELDYQGKESQYVKYIRTIR